MKLDDFNALTDEEKSTFLENVESNEKSIEDLNCELNSFKTENADLKKQLDANNSELKATKELNFTLARKITTASTTEDAETNLYNFMKGF